MATIKFALHTKSKNKQAPIYVRVIDGKKVDVRRKTNLFIDPAKWSVKNMPIQKDAETRQLAIDLDELKASIQKSFQHESKLGSVIDGNWLVNAINKHFNRTKTDDANLLVTYGKEYLKNLEYKQYDNGRIGASKSSSAKYKAVVKKLDLYDEYVGKKHALTDVDISYGKGITAFMKTEQKLSDNTVGRFLRFVKTICLDAKKNGYDVSDQLDFFKGFTVKTPKIYLTFEEIEKVHSYSFKEEKYRTTASWLVIGCYTGQRVSDLLRMNASMIKQIQGHRFIILVQQKTGKKVQIPIHPKVQNILDTYLGNFPPVFANNLDSAKALFNRYLKKVCEKAGLDEVVNGNKFDKDSKRYLNGNHSKHELVSSHICRRSFCTNFYSTQLYPTPLLMNITAHSSEAQFLDYIGKKPIDYSLQLARIWNNT
ncbi:hypothetical protein AAU57_14055 [Nonlabens sp. YIK11]|uniref:tyrosine-type recombinase/integrase n=1 Tax=Nonlabens sp. YIK11 TaxID=1453349 RepID=UPI0006DC7407|nr:tyrosine-type recombinase/integrase [Nonlabens sp. YIK11]KQC34337.1 hypothetical protein AAU57_14055 [Nonlabens sp. YIK11]